MKHYNISKYSTYKKDIFPKTKLAIAPCALTGNLDVYIKYG